MKKRLHLCLLLVAAALASSACAAPAKSFAATSFIVDGMSTRSALSRGCRETNPLYGSASGDEILAINLVGAAVIYAYGEAMPEWGLWTIGAIRSGATVNNLAVECP